VYTSCGGEGWIYYGGFNQTVYLPRGTSTGIYPFYGDRPGGVMVCVGSPRDCDVENVLD